MVALVGGPNVGKSVIFNYLTGSRVGWPARATVGSLGKMIWAGINLEIVDAPGIYSLPITAEEYRRLLWTERPALAIHVTMPRTLNACCPSLFGISRRDLDAGFEYDGRSADWGSLSMFLPSSGLWELR